MLRNKIIQFYHSILPKKLRTKKLTQTNLESNQFISQESVGTAPRVKVPLNQISQKAQNLVWDNEDASMQDKSYSFDEQVTDANYDEEDSLDFYDDQMEQTEKERYE